MFERSKFVIFSEVSNINKKYFYESNFYFLYQEQQLFYILL